MMNENKVKMNRESLERIIIKLGYASEATTRYYGDEISPFMQEIRRKIDQLATDIKDCVQATD